MTCWFSSKDRRGIFNDIQRSNFPQTKLRSCHVFIASYASGGTRTSPRGVRKLCRRGGGTNTRCVPAALLLPGSVNVCKSIFQILNSEGGSLVSHITPQKFETQWGQQGSRVEGRSVQFSGDSAHLSSLPQ